MKRSSKGGKGHLSFEIKYEQIDYSEAIKGKGEDKDVTTLNHSTQDNRTRGKGKNYLLSITSPVSNGQTNPAALVGIFKTQSHINRDSENIYHLAIKNAKTVNSVLLQSKEPRKQWVQRLAREFTSQLRPKSCRKHGTTVYYGFNKDQCFCICHRPLSDTICKQEHVKTNLRVDEVLMTDSDIFKMIALSVMNEAKMLASFDFQ